MQKTHVHVDPDNPTTFPQGQVDEARLDATTDEAIREHIAQDEAATMQEMGRYVRTIRARVGMSQRDFAHATCVSVDTLRNWEQGRRSSTATGGWRRWQSVTADSFGPAGRESKPAPLFPKVAPKAGSASIDAHAGYQRLHRRDPHAVTS